MFFPKETTPIQKVLFIGSSLASLGMFISFMNSYAVDVLMADRIDTWSSLFNNDSLWDGFIKQHGPRSSSVPPTSRSPRGTVIIRPPLTAEPLEHV